MQKGEYLRMYNVEDTHFWYRGMRQISVTLIKKYLPKKRGNYKILDAGCGTGAAMQWLSRYGEVAGFDISPMAVKFCKKRGLTNVHTGSIDAVPYTDSTFDLITCFDVLGQMEVTSDKKAIQEFWRVLKPGGILLLRVAAFDWLYSYHDRAVHTKHRYTPFELGNLFEKNKFKTLQITYANMILFPISLAVRVLGRVVAQRKKQSSDVKPIHPFLNKLLFIPLFIESWIIRYTSLPFGLSVIIVAQKNRK